MIIGSISENKNLEKRVSITPEISKKYISNGFKVKVEKGIADHLGIKDEQFVKEGCHLDTKENILKEADLLLQMNLPSEENLDIIKEKNILIGSFNLNNNKEIINKYKNKIIVWIKFFNLLFFLFGRGFIIQGVGVTPKQT